MLKVKHTDGEGRLGSAEVPAGSMIDEIARVGARRMLAAALKAEAGAYLAQFVDERDGGGHRLVVRNGHAEPGTVTTAAGAVRVARTSGERQAHRRDHR